LNHIYNDLVFWLAWVTLVQHVEAEHLVESGSPLYMKLLSGSPYVTMVTDGFTLKAGITRILMEVHNREDLDLAFARPGVGRKRQLRLSEHTENQSGAGKTSIQKEWGNPLASSLSF
jgi:hypothetical protein